MTPGLKEFDDIKQHFESEDGWQLGLHLVNNSFLLKEYISEFTKSSEIGFEAKTIQWHDDYEFNKVENILEGWRFNGRLIAIGDLILYKDLKESDRKSVKLKLWIEIIGRHYTEKHYFSFFPEGVRLKDETRNIIDSYSDLILKEYNSLTQFKDLEYEKLAKLWPHNTEGNKSHVFISSYDYFNEITNIYRQAKYSFAQASLYSIYCTNYFDEFKSEPFGHFRLALKIYHRKYLDYCTFTLQALYTFWERLGLLLFQYFEPEKVQLQTISFLKVAQAIKDAKKLGKYQNVDVNWLE